MSRAVVGVSLKAYLGLRDTEQWLDDVRAHLAGSVVEIFVLPSYPVIPVAVRKLSGTGIAVGSQDVSSHIAGPWTGDVTAATIREAGGTFAELGHSERRRWHGETDEVVAAKVARCMEAGLTPVLCVGESIPMPVAAASHHACAQLRARLAQARLGAELIVAYEPEWAIGAAAPASPEYIAAVVAALRAQAAELKVTARILYGGSAAEGVFTAARATPATAGWPDGLFIGRAALSVGQLVRIVGEVASAGALATGGGIGH
jgi:triosephosphate isomerase